jgi:NTP pyrophosphatase (non-canonical NTP hydrolase)
MEDTTTVEGVTILIRNFADERMWHRHHCPRNIALAMLGEVGELAEIFQWTKDEGEIEVLLSEKQLDKIGQEIADVAIYLLRLADVCHVQLGDEAMKILDARSEN